MVNLEELEAKLKSYADAYYNGQPIVDDSTYDHFKTMYENLKGKQFEQVGASVPEGKRKVRHSTPMRSLDNLFIKEDGNIDDVFNWMSNLFKKHHFSKMVLEPKLDGLALALYYQEGRLIDAVTRGDGSVGESVLDRIVPSELGIPSTIDIDNPVQIVGEVVLDKDSFEKINESLDESLRYRTARNAAAGMLRAKDNRNKPLSFIAYGLFEEEMTIKNHIEVIDKLVKNHFNIAETLFTVIGKKDFDEQRPLLEAFLKDFMSKRKETNNHISAIMGGSVDRSVREVECDGLVAKVVDIGLYKDMIGTSHHPDWAIAIKFPTERVITRITNIVGQVGRTGVVTPVAHLQPVEIGGVVVSRATLNNFNHIEVLGINIGDEVYLQRAGEVIPEIISKVNLDEDNDRYFKPFTHCPVCNSELGLRERREFSGMVYCNNTDCEGVNLQKMIYAVSRDALDIKGLGESLIEKWQKKGFLKNWTGIFRLTPELIKSEHPGKEGDNIIQAIENHRTLDASKILTSMGMTYIGRSKSKEIAYALADAGRTNSIAELLTLRFKELVPHSNFGSMFSTKYFRENEALGGLSVFTLPEEYVGLFGDIVALEKEGLIKIEYPKIEGENLPLKGKTYCITGTFDMGRHEIEHFLISHGAKVTSSVSARLSGLFVGENPGSKAEKGSRLGVPIITDLQEFMISVTGIGI